MSQITELASKLFSHPSSDKDPFPHKTLPTAKRVRGQLNGHMIFDTTSALLVWEHKFFPQYWIPKKDFLDDEKGTVKWEWEKAVSGVESSTATLTTKSGAASGGEKGREVKVLVVPEGFNSELAGYVKIEFKNLDAWYEELGEVLFHPKDPFHRVDVIPSGRHVKVAIGDTVLADTGNEGGVVSLWETNFPARWYLPRTAVRWEWLRESKTKTGCPYKGEASYYDAVLPNGEVVKDVVWWYPQPMIECGNITGLLCFYPDKVRTWVDGGEIERVGMPFKDAKEKAGVNGSLGKPKGQGER